MSGLAARAIGLLALCCLLLGPTASAAEGTIDSFYADGQTEMRAETPLVQFNGEGLFTLDGEAAIAWGDHYAQRYTRIDSGLTAVQFDDTLDCQPAELVEGTITQEGAYCAEQKSLHAISDGRIAGSPLTAEYQVRLFAEPGQMFVDGVAMELDGRGHMSVGARAGVAYNDLDKSGAVEQSGVTDDHQTPGAGDARPMFTPRSHTGGYVLSTVQGTDSTVTVTGDFIMEVAGLSMSVGYLDSAPNVYPTGWSEREDVQAEFFEDRDFQILRLSLQDATVAFTMEGLTKMEMASKAVDLMSTTASLYVAGATGQLDDGAVGVSPVEFLPPYQATMGHDGQSVGATIVPAIVTPEAASMMERAWFQWFLYGLAAVLFVLAIVGLVVRQTTMPPLPSIESALEQGQYRKAARLAGRVIRREPMQESAQLARAIAWSRMGAHERIIRHLEPFLRRHEPSDGTIHYVLGLAHHDAGNADAAREAMAAAVARTPSLLSEVDPDLRLPTEGDPSGYS